MAPQTRGARFSRDVGRDAWSRSPSSFRPGGPTGSALRTQCALGVPRARILPGAPGCPAAMHTMTLPRARVGVWAAAAKVAQRRHRVEDAGRSWSPVAQSERAALYVHVSGNEEAEL